MRDFSKQQWLDVVRDRKEGGVNLSARGKRKLGHQPGLVAPASLNELQRIMHPATARPTPIRALGANSASTQCSTAIGGTIVDMTLLNKITDLSQNTVTVQAGVSLAELTEFLAEQNLELPCAIDLVARTVGGAVSGACFGPSHDGQSAFLTSQVLSLKVVTPTGQLLIVDETKSNLLNVFRMSMGVLGIVYEVTLRVRPLERFVLRQRKMSVAMFAHAANIMLHQRVGIKFFYLPFKDRIYAELRRAEISGKRVRSLPWRLKDWGESAVLPAICAKLSRIVPIASVRYSLVDGINEMGQALLTNSMTEGGSAAVEARTQTSGRFVAPPLQYSTWCFPADDIEMLLQAYKTFAAEYYKEHKFRCDMPMVGFRLPVDRSALLSPCFDAPMIALRAVSNPHPLWDDYVMDFAEFAQRWGGVPMFNQSRCAEPTYTSTVFGSRLDFFKKIRRQLDPDNRMLNPFLANYLS